VAGDSDGIRWAAWARVEKFSPDQVAYAARASGLADPGAAVLRALCGVPEDGTAEATGNLLVTAGLNALTLLIIGGGGEPFSNANAIVGVGAGVTAATTADTALTDDGTANAWYQQAGSGWPTQSNGLIQVVSTFGTAAGNFGGGWNEWCWAIGGGGTITAGTTLSAVTSTAPVMVNHKVQGFGVKSPGAAWVFTTQTTLS
jgi:hypothetical protein